MTASTAADLADRFPHVLKVFQQGRDRGLHHGLQLWIARDGQVQADAALGEARPGEPLTPDHWLQWLSAGKPLTAAAIARVWEQGRLQLDDPVATFLPEFAVRGKERITFRHLLTHTAGLRSIDTGWPEFSWDETIAAICNAAPDPDAIYGRTAGYHVASTWFLLGETLQRLLNRPYVDLMQTELFAPCGMSATRMAVTSEEQVQLGHQLAPLWERDRTDLRELDWHMPPRVERPSPGSTARGPIRDLGRFYEMLRREGAASHGRVLQPTTVAALTARHRVGDFDQTLGHVIDFGLGFIIDSNRYGADTVPYGYGRFCSPRTFGHGGAQSSQGYCDPEHALAVAYVFNGRAGEGQHNRRCRAINDAIYRDLGLAD